MTSLEWLAREPPLAARVVVAQDDAALRLVDRLLDMTDDALARIEGVASRRHPEAQSTVRPSLGYALVALRTSGELPWVDGVRYFGEATEAPGVYLPTVRRPTGPLELQAAALRRKAPSGPIVWLQDGRIIPLSDARPLDRATLTAWRAP